MTRENPSFRGKPCGNGSETKWSERREDSRYRGGNKSLDIRLVSKWKWEDVSVPRIPDEMHMQSNKVQSRSRPQIERETRGVNVWSRSKPTRARGGLENGWQKVKGVMINEWKDVLHCLFPRQSKKTIHSCANTENEWSKPKGINGICYKGPFEIIRGLKDGSCNGGKEGSYCWEV